MSQPWQRPLSSRTPCSSLLCSTHGLLTGRLLCEKVNAGSAAGSPERDDGDEGAQTFGHELDEKLPMIKCCPAVVLSSSTSAVLGGAYEKSKKKEQSSLSSGGISFKGFP